MSAKMVSILLGAAIVAVLSSSYLSLINCLCCAGVIIGAMVSVWHYTGEHNLTIETGEGAAIGALAAVIGYFAAFLIDFPLSAMGVGSVQVQGAVFGAFEDMLPAEAVADAQAEPGLAMRLLFGLIGIAVSAVFGAVGGALGAALFKRGEPPIAGEPPFAEGPSVSGA